MENPLLILVSCFIWDCQGDIIGPHFLSDASLVMNAFNVTLVAWLLGTDATGTFHLNHCNQVAKSMGNKEMEGEETVRDHMVRTYSLYTTAALKIEWPAKRIKVFRLMWSQNDTKGEDILVLCAYHRW